MFRLLLAFSLIMVLVTGCGETRHPVRQDTLAPAAPEDLEGAGDSTATVDGGIAPALPGGHPPLPAIESQDPARPPVGADLGVTPPEGWVVVEPASSMIQAEFALPKADGDQSDGRLTVMRAGGSIDANVERWRKQFEELEEKPIEELDVSGVKVTLVDLSGTFNEQRGMMMGPATKRPGYQMLGAIIQDPEGMLFVKAYGPKNTMAKHAAPFHSFVKSLATPSE